MSSVETRPVNLAEDWAAMEGLFASGPEHPVAPGRLRQLSLRRARACVTPESSSIAVQPGGEVCGLACWTRLTWDSEHLGFPAGRIEFLLAGGGYDCGLDIKRSLLARVLEQARERGIRHLIARVDATDLTSVHALERHGFEVVDAIQTFSLQLKASHGRNGVVNRSGESCRCEDSGRAGGSARQSSQRNAVPAHFETRLFREEDLPQVVEIAKSAYVHDRFHADAAIGCSTADRINEEWLRNSCSLKAADAVVVAVDESKVLGYVTCKIDHEAKQAAGFCFATIVMVATRQEARGRGVAQACTSAALDWFKTHSVDVVEVGTQLRNIPAARLYEKNGFRMAASSFTLRKIV